MERNKENVEEKKFELTDEYVVNEYGVKLFQIRCLRTFGHAQKGDFWHFTGFAIVLWIVLAGITDIVREIKK